MAASFGLVYFPSTFLHPSNSYTHQFLCAASPFSLSTSNVLSQRSQRPKRSNFYLFHVAKSQMVQDKDDDDDDNSSDSRLLAENGTGVENEATGEAEFLLQSIGGRPKWLVYICNRLAPARVIVGSFTFIADF